MSKCIQMIINIECVYILESIFIWASFRFLLFSLSSLFSLCLPHFLSFLFGKYLYLNAHLLNNVLKEFYFSMLRFTFHFFEIFFCITIFFSICHVIDEFSVEWRERKTQEERAREGKGMEKGEKNEENINKSVNANDYFVLQKRNISHFRFRCNFQHCNIAPLTNHRFS